MKVIIMLPVGNLWDESWKQNTVLSFCILFVLYRMVAKCTVAGEMFTMDLAFEGLVWCSGSTASHTSNCSKVQHVNVVTKDTHMTEGRSRWELESEGKSFPGERASVYIFWDISRTYKLPLDFFSMAPIFFEVTYVLQLCSAHKFYWLSHWDGGHPWLSVFWWCWNKTQKSTIFLQNCVLHL